MSGADAEASLPAPRRRLGIAIGGVLGSVALVGLSVLLVDPRQVAARLSALDARWLAAFFAVYVFQLGVLGLRWSTISRQLGVPLGWRRASAEYALSVLVNSVLPTGFAGDGFRALRHSQRSPQHAFTRVLEALALDRVSGQLALWLVVLMSAPFSVKAGLLDPLPVALALLGLGLAAWLVTRRLERAATWPNASRALRAFVGRARSVMLDPRRALVHLPLSMLLTGTLVLQLWMSARAAGIVLDIGLVSWLGPLIILAASAPSFLGSWGVREGASALLFATAGLPSSAGVTVSLLFGSFSLACALPGVLVLLFDTPYASLSEPLAAPPAAGE